MIHISEVFGAGLSHRGINEKASFPTIQGEGLATGRPTIFVRFFGCSLRCEGFSQPNPADRSTYEPTILQLIDPKSIKTLSEFKTPTRGCDTGYAVYPQFKHLRIDYATAAELYDDAIDPLLYKTADGHSAWKHPVTQNVIDLCFTGGEPMMHQKSMAELIALIDSKVDHPITIQIETNGTRAISDELVAAVEASTNIHLMINASPKLLNVAGEPDEKAWFPDILKGYFDWSMALVSGCIKVVVSDSDACWEELNRKAPALAECGVPIYVMPAGAVYSQQCDQAYIRTISERALKEGYCISPRLHVNIWDGCVGC